ncbi:MAG: hypothetical protein M1818_000808 [Claussenomyces sp. TS43310]|nr:MAG: hypothetical protein M1818_000808 [Claussenomyces sp. TS43310]
MASIEKVVKSIEKVILDPKYADFFTILKAARNGAVYGAKVRFPHAFVYVLLSLPQSRSSIKRDALHIENGLIAFRNRMIFLFRSGSVREKVRLIVKATTTHAQNLAKFATIYKLSMLVLRRMGATPGKEGPYDAFFAGLLGGYLVFGQRHPRTGKISSVSQQIVIYVFARVVLAAAKLAIRPEMGIVGSAGLSKKIGHDAWPLFAAASWASVMYMFRWHPDTIQSSLHSSMKYIYNDCEHWDSLRTLVWHNR